MVRGEVLVSIVVPAYNAGRFVAAAVGSALSQGHETIEVIVIDDGSTDDTASVVEAIAARDRRVQLVRTSRGGPARARNRGIELARGEMIAPLDADDLWAPDKLERQIEAMRAGGPDVGVVYCWTSAIDEAGRVLAPLWRPRRETGDVLELAVANGLIGNASVPLIRKSVFQRAGGYCEALRLGEDWDFHVRAAAVTRFEVVRAPLVGYRLWGGGATSADDWRAELEAMTSRIRQMWPELRPEVLRRRAFHIEVFLTFLAIRRGNLAEAAKLLARMGWAMPAEVMSREGFDILALFLAHLAGFRRYAWMEPRARLFPSGSSGA